MRYRFTKKFDFKVDDIQTQTYRAGGVHDENDLSPAVIKKALKDKAIEVVGQPVAQPVADTTDTAGADPKADGKAAKTDAKA